MRILLLSILLSFSHLCFSQEIVLEGDKYYLKGECEILKKEIAYFSENEVRCQCKKKQCKVELTGHLPNRIQEMLKIKETVTDGPNCWNSVLFSLGANQKLRFSQDEMDFWMRSPLCEKRKGSPKPGDLVNVHYIYPDKTLLLMHTFQVLSPSISFNKTGPSSIHPYEVIQRDEYFDRYLFPEDCRFVEIEAAVENKCEMISTAYHCNNLDSAFLSLQKSSHDKIKKDLEYLENCAQSGAMGETLPWDDLLTMSKALQELALDKLKVPKQEETPKEIQEILTRHSEDMCDDCLPWHSYVPDIYFYASPEMKLESFPTHFRAAIEEARKRKLYAQISLEDRLMWTNVYLSGESLQGQFEINKNSE